jgi:phage baseplate assembly protein W
MAKKIVFHPYALYKIGKRGIAKADIEETMRDPSSVLEAKFGRRIAQRIYGSYLLRVVFEEYEDHYLVITAYPARAQRYLRR